MHANFESLREAKDGSKLLMRCHSMRALPLPYTVTPYSTALVRLDVQILIYYKGLRCGRRVALLYTLK